MMGRIIGFIFGLIGLVATVFVAWLEYECRFNGTYCEESFFSENAENLEGLLAQQKALSETQDKISAQIDELAKEKEAVARDETLEVSPVKDAQSKVDRVAQENSKLVISATEYEIGAIPFEFSETVVVREENGIKFFAGQNPNANFLIDGFSVAEDFDIKILGDWWNDSSTKPTFKLRFADDYYILLFNGSYIEFGGRRTYSRHTSWKRGSEINEVLFQRRGRQLRLLINGIAFNSTVLPEGVDFRALSAENISQVERLMRFEIEKYSGKELSRTISSTSTSHDINLGAKCIQIKEEMYKSHTRGYAALAASPSGACGAAWNWNTAEEARDDALRRCAKNSDECRIVEEKAK